MAKSPKIHPEDIAIAREILKATEWSAHLRVGPTEKYTTRGIATYEAAKAEAERLTAEHSRFGRKGIVYAIVGQRIYHADDAMMAIVRGLDQ